MRRKKLLKTAFLRKILCFVLCAAYFAALAPRAGADFQRPAVVTSVSGPAELLYSPGGTALTTLADGTSVTVTGRHTLEDGSVWYELFRAGEEPERAYIPAGQAAVLPGDSAEVLDREGTVSGFAVGLWSEPDASAGSIAVLETGSSLRVEKSTSVGETLWYFVKTGSGLRGYCMAESVELTETAPPETPAPEGSPVPGDTPAPENSPAPPAETDAPATAEPPAETRDTYFQKLTEAGFPASYRESLWALHQKYPLWEFRALHTGVDFTRAVEEEHTLGVSLVSADAPSSWKSTQDGAYNWTDSTWNELDSGGWVAASREIIAYYLDPRNGLDENSVFQFLYQGFDSGTQTPEGLRAMTEGSFLADTGRDLDGDGSNGITTYTDTLYAAGSAYGVNPYILAAMMTMEMGTDGRSDSISGTNGRFPGYYNAFNLGAYKDGNFSAVERGLWYASGGNNGGTSYGRPWNTLYKAVMGGAEYYARNFVGRGQDTLYLKRFNVQGSNMFRNQYMTNVGGAASEGRLLSGAYSQSMRDTPMIFSIPVFNNMPSSPCVRPTGDGSPNAKLQSLSVTGGELSPRFSRDVHEYTVIVDHETASVTVEARAQDPAARVSGTGETPLSVGENRLTLTVTAGNGTTGQYVITVMRREAQGPVSFTGPYRLSGEGRITGIGPGTTGEEFLGKLGLTGGRAEISRGDGSECPPDSLMRTGDALRVYIPEENGGERLYGSYSVLIYGDVNGDGGVMINDLIKIRNHLLGTGTLSGLSLAAADTNRDGTVMINDLIKLRNHIGPGPSIVQ